MAQFRGNTQSIYLKYETICIWQYNLFDFFFPFYICLSKLVENRLSSWADYLEATMFGLRTKKQITTKFSPYFLQFGGEARYQTPMR